MTHTLSMVAARNEAGTIGDVVRGLKKFSDVLVVVNPSTDDTAELAEKAGADRVLRNATDLNIGGSLRLAYKTALELYGWPQRYDRFVQIDAGGSHRVDDAATLLEAFARLGWADILIGSRLMKDSVFVQAPLRKTMTKVAGALGHMATGLGVADYTSGLRVFNSHALRVILKLATEEKGHAFNWMTAVSAAQRGCSLAWVPITYVATSSSATWGSVLESFMAVVMALDFGRPNFGASSSRQSDN